MKGPYDDIIHLPHHVSDKHPHMPIADRAAQFMPFRALTGYGAAIEEAARLTEDWIDQSEDVKIDLDRKLRIVAEHLADQPEITIVYFVPDAWKVGGAYTTVTGCIKKIDTFEQVVVMQAGTKIPIGHIFDIEGTIFSEKCSGNASRNMVYCEKENL